jgi:hypothetical protein
VTVEELIARLQLVEPQDKVVLLQISNVIGNAELVETAKLEVIHEQESYISFVGGAS